MIWSDRSPQRDQHSIPGWRRVVPWQGIDLARRRIDKNWRALAQLAHYRDMHLWSGPRHAATLASAVQYSVIMALSHLAETLVMDRTSLYRALRPMVRSGWLLIKEAPKGRAKIVQLSKAGIRATTTASDIWHKVQSQIIGEYGVGRWAPLHRAITELTALGVKLGS